VAERVGRRAVQGQFRSDTHTHNHETELVVERICQNAPKVVLDYRVEDWERGHGRSDIDQGFGPGEAAREGINGKFGRECAEDYGSGHGRLRIGVLQPVVQKRKRAFDSKCHQDQFSGHGIDADMAEVDRTRICIPDDRSSQ